jgi:hypothetical protein
MFSWLTDRVYNKQAALFYSIFFVALFAVIYKTMGVKQHFDVPEYLQKREHHWLTSIYCSALAQSNAMPDLVPKTDMARTLFMLQVILGWMWFLVLS